MHMVAFSGLYAEHHLHHAVRIISERREVSIEGCNKKLSKQFMCATQFLCTVLTSKNTLTLKAHNRAQTGPKIQVYHGCLSD